MNEMFGTRCTFAGETQNFPSGKVFPRIGLASQPLFFLSFFLVKDEEEKKRLETLARFLRAIGM